MENLLTRVPVGTVHAICTLLRLDANELARRCAFGFDPIEPGVPGQFGMDPTGRKQFKITVCPQACKWNRERPWTTAPAYNVLVHELTHYRQTITGKMAPFDGRRILWCGRPADTSFKTHAEYLNFPWEREADEESRTIVNQLISCGLVRLDPHNQYGF
jgi:hypothetical protein